MVPSWTETLLWAGVEVVGRTRFCLHPETVVGGIPIVGGTKDWNLDKVQAAAPDLVVLDQEENPLAMAEAGLPYWASHVRGIGSMPEALSELAQQLQNSRLEALAQRWHKVLQRPRQVELTLLPGVVEWGRRPRGEVENVVYVIWKDPWMAVGPETFIGSVLAHLGLSVYPFDKPYPQVELEAFPESTLLLFSSEPYPFLRKREGLDRLKTPYAFVDGESFSWFGVRSLRFLENALSPDTR